MKSKICLITGANSGIGKAAAKGLAAMGMHVIMVCRSIERGQEAREEIVKKTGNLNISLMIADLASQESIREFVEVFKRQYKQLDVLINNAGVNTSHQSLTQEGVDLIFGVNHLAPFLLTHLLMPSLQASPAARIINVASMWARDSLDWDNLHEVHDYDHVCAYGYSKLCNLIFTCELARRLKDTPITVNACHPGAVKSNLGRDYQGRLGVLNKLAQWVMPDSAQGAAVMSYLATSPEVEGMTGCYFDPKKREESMPPFAADPANGERLWALSKTLTGIGDEIFP